MKKGMTDRNPHTGEKLQSKHNSDAYRDNFDKIFKKSEKRCPVCNEKEEDFGRCKLRNCEYKEYVPYKLIRNDDTLS